LIGKANDLKTTLAEKERLYFVEHRHGNAVAKANGVTFEGGVQTTVAVPAIKDRLRCWKCGERPSETRPDWSNYPDLKRRAQLLG
jgi:hypothetical protein